MTENNSMQSTVRFKDALKFWTKLGFISFGGPAGQIAVMHQETVERQKWISENQFLRALNFCMLLPGPEAQQLATYIGWRLHGIPGGVAAGSLFVIPSVFVMLVLSWLAVAQIHIPAVAAAFYGVQPVVVAIVIEAVVRIGKKALKHRLLYGFAAAAFIGIAILRLPFPLIVGLSALAGFLMSRRTPEVFCKGDYDPETRECRMEEPAPSGKTMKSFALHALGTGLIFFALWLAVAGPVWMFAGFKSTLSDILLFFTKAAFVTFGGAYAVLGYIADTAVQKGWLSMQEMVMGLGLAESTPGPLIMVTQFVGFLGAWHLPEGLSPMTAGILGALITTYVTFLPSFFFIFTGAPFIEAMAGNSSLQAALTGVTAAVVGVVLNLALWFGYKVMLPQGTGPDIFAMASALVSLILILKYHIPLHYMVLLGALSGICFRIFI